jgi:hypothetical protein
VRPTDEDQSSSRRPNLMSSTRRTASETNILAMLDRQEGGGLMRRILRGFRNGPPLMWYGAAGMLVIVLVGSLAWLARDNGSSASVDSALAGAVGSGAKQAPEIAVVPAPASLAVSAEASAEAADLPPAAGATIVDLAPAAESAAEPMAPVQAAPVQLPHALPPQQHAGRIAPRDVQHDPLRPAAHATLAKAAPRPPVARAPAARPAVQAHAEARGRRPAGLPKPAPKPAPGAVDTDVALISAIIQHANKRQEAEEAARKP